METRNISNRIDNQSWQTYLTVFTYSVLHRFPTVVDVNTLDPEVIRRIGELSLVCSNIALDVWSQNVSTSQISQDGRQMRQQQRVA